MIGQKLAHYEITRHLGSGGMGDVYQATDSKLGRSVAIKLLPAAFARDTDRVARFEREARVLASLNHPNIAAIYGLEQSATQNFLVMELVGGETLAERIKRGPIPVAEALAIAKQIAEALETAHESGVVHRDLKPANIKITPDGKVKVLDFGLAKALAAEDANANLSNSPTMSLAATNAGVILGTAAYMSPEQAKGSASVDKRTDLFSFGSVLYEMLTGRQAFQGETVTELFASVLAREPDLARLPANLNPKIVDVIRRCLQKDLKKRWQAAGDLRVEIENVLADPNGLEVRETLAAARRPLWKIAAFGFVCLVLGAAIGGVTIFRSEPVTPAKPARFSIVLPQDQSFTTTNGRLVTLSPDGTTIVYVANNQLYTRALGELNSHPIPGTDLNVSNPFFSPDGQWIGFWSGEDSTLKKIAISGGVAVTLCKTISNPTDPTWDRDRIIFGHSGVSAIFEVPSTGGSPQQIVTLGPDEEASRPQVLPDGKSILFTLRKRVGEDRFDTAQIVTQSLETGERKVLIQGGGSARYSRTGHIIYPLGTSLWTLPFDVSRLEVTGSPVPIVEGVMRNGDPGTAVNFGFSENGTLIYVPTNSFSAANLRSLALVDRTGKAQVLPLPPGYYARPRVSPDGKKLAFEMEGAVWLYDFSQNSALRKLTFGEPAIRPAWSADSLRVTFRSARDGKGGIFWQPADGSGTAERLTTDTSEQQHFPHSWSADGRILTIQVTNPINGNRGIWTLATNDRKLELFDDDLGSLQLLPSISRNGRWIAYESDESGEVQVYVQPFPKTGAKYQVSREGGLLPFWSPDGKELFYYQSATNRVASVAVQTEPSFSFQDSVGLPLGRIYQPAGSARMYDIMPDGRQFLVQLPASETVRRDQEIHVVLNWFEELQQRVPAQ